MRFICHVPGDTNGLIYFLASNGRTWSQPQPPCDDEHYEQCACDWATAAASAVSQSLWPVSLQQIRGHAPLRVVTSNCPGLLQQGTKQSMLGIPHARVPTYTLPCLDPTSTVEHNTNRVMIDLGSPSTILLTGTLFLLLWRQSPDANRAATALGQQLAAHKARGRLASGKAPNVTESTVFRPRLHVCLT